MKRKKRHPKYLPYKQVKMNFYTTDHPFRDVPVELRRQAMSEATAKARATFDEEFPKLRTWFGRRCVSLMGAPLGK